jgi:Ca2+-transporting ATPase
LKPRENLQPLFSKADYQRMVFESGTISAGSLGAYVLGLMRYGPGARATTMAFQSLTIGQLLHAFSCRSENHTILEYGQLPRNRYLTTSVAASLGVQLLTMFVPPIRNLLGLTTLGAGDMALIGGFSALPLFINEASKNRKVEHV